MTMRQIREAAGLTQVQLAEICGVTQGAIAQWENGVSFPQAEKVVILSKTLKASERAIIDSIAQAKKERQNVGQ